MARPLAPLTARIENFIRAEARGMEHDQVLKEFFNVDENSDPKEKNKAEQQIFRWRHRPDYEAIWNDELKSAVRRHVPVAMSRIISQIDSNTEWLANKAANDVILLAGKTGVVQNQETALQVQITGMPDIGYPDENA